MGGGGGRQLPLAGYTTDKLKFSRRKLANSSVHVHGILIVHYHYTSLNMRSEVYGGLLVCLFSVYNSSICTS